MATAQTKAAAPGQTEKQSVLAPRGKNGGARPNAGRKPGTPNKATLERQKRAAETGILPIDVMLDNMRWAHAGASKMLKNLGRLRKVDESTMAKIKVVEQLRRMSQDCAKDAAPYLHPKLQSVMFGQDPDREAVKVVHTVDQETIERIRGTYVSKPT